MPTIPLRRIKPYLAVAVILLTVGVFAYYISRHPETIRQLTKLPLVTIGLLLALYFVMLATLTWIQQATLALCDIRLGSRESFLLVMYSSIINFFGPLQSGPAFRAAYLKRRHNVKLGNYALATLLYYAFYALFSAIFLLTYFIGFAALAAIVIVALGVPLLLLAKPNLLPVRFRELKLQHVGYLAAGTLAQVTVFAVIFYTELNALGSHIGVTPALIYTGAANFALFVSLTPGAIGFRESFLVFSERLHHLTGANIFTASLIDRGVYIAYLGILAAFIFGLHAQDYLQKPMPAKKIPRKP